jgi:hypothetical protein
MSNFRRLVLGLMLVSLAGVSWGDCVEGNCVNGKGKYTYASGGVYEGDWKDGKRTGKGKYTWADGGVYEGDWKYGMRTGKGKYTWANGDVYEGDWIDGELRKGKYTYASGNVYEGDWKYGMRTGKGKLTWADGSVYEGDWKDDEEHGLGKLTDSTGIFSDEGVFKDGKYLGTVAEMERKEKQRLAELEKFQRIFNACLLDKSSGLDMQVKSIEAAVKATCETIAEDPSWLQSLQYD